MPSWSAILGEVTALQKQHGPRALDVVRRKYLTALQQYTRRNTVLYATRWTQPPFGAMPPELTMIGEEDMEGFMEVFNGLSPSEGLDVILHSPGGSAEATEALVTYTRSKFQDVRVLIPHVAMSAATMFACSANKIVMGPQSSVGPTDPQFTVVGEGGARMSVSAQAILDQFSLAKKECRDPKNLPAWVPMLTQYGPALLVQCEEALKLSKELVKTWLAKYMLRGQRNAARKSAIIARQLAQHATFKTHARHIGRDQARSFGLLIDNLEQDPQLEDLVLSVFHSTTLTFSGTPATKIIENHLGRAWVRTLVIGTALPPTPPPVPPPQPPSAPSPQPPSQASIL